MDADTCFATRSRSRNGATPRRRSVTWRRCWGAPKAEDAARRRARERRPGLRPGRILDARPATAWSRPGLVAALMKYHEVESKRISRSKRSTRSRRPRRCSRRGSDGAPARRQQRVGDVVAGCRGVSGADARRARTDVPESPRQRLGHLPDGGQCHISPLVASTRANTPVVVNNRRHRPAREPDVSGLELGFGASC